jgi:outer membrane protein, heavy metal efflux system
MPAGRPRGLCAALLGAILTACAGAPPRAPPQPARTLAEFDARRLDALPGLPPAAQGWDRAQWLDAALQLNPGLAAERSQVTAVAAAERTAAEHPNPTLDLFGEYLTTTAHSSAWLYGLSLDFLLRQSGERARIRRRAALETALAQSDLAESLWGVRGALRQALLDAAAAQDEATLLESLVGQRQGLLDIDRDRVQLGEIARTQLLADQAELAHAERRRAQSQAKLADALARLAAAVGVPASALDAVPVRWHDWAAIDALSSSVPGQWRAEALIGRPQIVRALREYDLAELALESEVAKRWPQLHVTPAYAWGGNGVREGALEDIARESAVGVSLELPLFNQHQGAIGEAIARRTAAGKRLIAVQAQIYEQIDRAERAWPAACAAWEESEKLAAIASRQRADEQRALEEGAGDRAGLVSAGIAATEAQLAVLEAAYAAEMVFGALEDAYRRPLEGTETVRPSGSASHS